MNRKKRSNTDTSQNGAPMKATAQNHRQPLAPFIEAGQAELSELQGAPIGHGAGWLGLFHEDSVLPLRALVFQREVPGRIAKSLLERALRVLCDEQPGMLQVGVAEGDISQPHRDRFDA